MTINIEALNPQGIIGRCQAMLFNRMQCTRGASYKSIDSTTQIETEYCTFHARVLQEEMNREKVNTEPKEDENGVLVDDNSTGDSQPDDKSSGITS